MSTMNHIRKSIVIGLTVLGIGGAGLAVHAQGLAPTPAAAPAPAPAQAQERGHDHAMSQEQRQAKWREHAAKRQAKLHDALKLTPAQEPAWAAFQAAVKPDGMRGHGDRAAWKSMNAPQRLEKAIEMSRQRTATMESHLAALKTFYAVLTPEQQKVFDQASMRHGRHMHHGQHMKRTG